MKDALGWPMLPISGTCRSIRTLRFILGVKSGDHKYLFDYVDACVKKGEAKEFVLPDPENDEILTLFSHRL